MSQTNNATLSCKILNFL